MAEPTATPLSHAIELRLTGYPDVPNKHGSGHIRPTDVDLRYRDGHIRANLYGRWVREDGELTDAPISQNYAAHNGNTTDWPDELAALAREHQPVNQADDDGIELARAALLARGGPTLATGIDRLIRVVERRMAVQAQQPVDQAAVRAAVEQAVYEYRELTCQWDETDGTTQAIAAHATRAALRPLGLPTAEAQQDGADRD